MCTISNTSGPDGYGETPGQNGNFADAVERKQYYKSLIEKADTVPLIKVFYSYGLRIDQYNRKITCPFKSHKGGNERSASFYYYPDTNSFRCYGCGIGNQYAHSVDFVSSMENISKIKSATKIIKLFGGDIDETAISVEQDSYKDKVDLLLKFSNLAYEFRRNNSSEQSLIFIENICKSFDALNAKLNLNNSALTSVINQLENMISKFEDNNQI